MIRSLYTAGWSMLALNKKMDTVSNNLANVNTTAFKKDIFINESFDEMLTKKVNDNQPTKTPNSKIGKMSLGFDVGEVFTVYNQGSVLQTGNNTDLSIQDANNAFFTIGKDDGKGNLQELYSKDGSFVIDGSGSLVTHDGKPVMGQNGAIKLKNGDFTVQDDGSIIQGNKVVDKLLIKQFDDTRTLTKYGENLVQKTQATKETPFNGVIKQGYLEQSNVNTVKEMVDMITVQRHFEANQKIITALDGTLDKLVNEVGNIR